MSVRLIIWVERSNTYALGNRKDSISKRGGRSSGNWALSGCALTATAGTSVDWDGGAENGDSACEAVTARANAAGTLPGLEE